MESKVVDTRVKKVAKRDKTLKSPLIDKEIKIALVERNHSSLYKDKDQGTLLTGASKSFGCPIDKYGNLVNPLEAWERDFLEDYLNIDLNTNVENTLANPYAGFWMTKKSKLKLTKPSRSVSSATVKLSLKDPFQFILYKIALINPRVARTWDQRYEKKEYEFVILDGDVKLEEELGYLEQEDVVFEYLLKNKKSKKKLFDLLRLYGSNKNSGLVKYSSSIDFIYNEIRKYARVKSEVKKLYAIITLGENDIYSKVFLADAVTVGLIEKSGETYRLMGGDRIGSNDVEAITYLDDVINQSTKLRVQQAIENYYKDK